LVKRIDDLAAKALEQFESRSADLRNERVGAAGDEESDTHVALP
jgi:hypothetical protein